MEIKNGKKVIITGRTICQVAGILSAICGIYWIAKALFYNETELPAILSSIVIALFLNLYVQKR